MSSGSRSYRYLEARKQKTERLYELLTEKKKKRGLKDLWFFDKHILNYKDMTSKDRFHGEMCSFVEDDNHKKLMVLEPRGSLKSSCITIGYSLRELVKNPNARGLICSEEFLTACKFLTEIKGHIENNEEFIRLYGDLKGTSKWSEKEIIIRTRKTWSKEPTLTAAGIDVTKVGLHYDFIVIDDPHSLKNIRTRERIQKVLEWYKLLLSLLDPGGKLIIIGTRWHYDDLFGWIIDQERMRTEEGKKKRYHILKRTAVRGKLDSHTPDNSLLWPERLSRDFLLDTLAEQGPYHFSCQYRNRPVDDDSAVFKRSWVQFYDPETLPKGLPTFSVLDPMRDEEGADWSALVTFSMDRNWVFYIREVRRGKWDEHETVEQMFRAWQKWKPVKMGIEAIAWQKVFARFVKAEMIRQGKKLPIIELKGDTRVTKRMRVKSMVPYWKAGYFKVPGKTISSTKGNMAILLDELLRYPRVSADDCVDALAYSDVIARRPQIHRLIKRLDPKSFEAARLRAKQAGKLGSMGINALRLN